MLNKSKLIKIAQALWDQYDHMEAGKLVRDVIFAMGEEGETDEVWTKNGALIEVHSGGHGFEYKGLQPTSFFVQRALRDKKVLAPTRQVKSIYDSLYKHGVKPKRSKINSCVTSITI